MLLHCFNVKFTHCSNVKMPHCFNAIFLHCLNVIPPHCFNAMFLHCLNVILPYRFNVIFLHCHNVSLPQCFFIFLIKKNSLQTTFLLSVFSFIIRTIMSRSLYRFGHGGIWHTLAPRVTPRGVPELHVDSGMAQWRMFVTSCYI